MCVETWIRFWQEGIPVLQNHSIRVLVKETRLLDNHRLLSQRPRQQCSVWASRSINKSKDILSVNEGLYLLLKSGKRMGHGLKPGSIHTGAASLNLNTISIELAWRHRVNNQLLRKVQKETLQCSECKCLIEMPLPFLKMQLRTFSSSNHMFCNENIGYSPSPHPPPDVGYSSTSFILVHFKKTLRSPFNPYTSMEYICQ